MNPPLMENAEARPSIYGGLIFYMEKQREIVYVDGFNFYKMK